MTHIDNDDFIIVKNNQIIYVKYGLVNLKTMPITQNTHFYVNGVLNYTNGHYGPDALFIKRQGNQIKMMISNTKGWVNANDVELIPLAHIKSPSHYFLNSHHELVHAITTDIRRVNAFSFSGPLDQAPNYLKRGNQYYSYDGIYFCHRL